MARAPSRLAICRSRTFTFDRSGGLLELGDDEGLTLAPLGVGVADGEPATVLLPVHPAATVNRSAYRASLRRTRSAYGGRLCLERITRWPLFSCS